ncbi:MAG: histidine phosphatase family protein [Candidatus Rokubacteria bacterium]|nr:histidine phosphatase family protein [Candidatus Rokubacteria bacterium]
MPARDARPEPATVVMFVRHGSTPTTGKVLPGRAPGLSLSDHGRKEVEATAERIARVSKVAAVYASPLERTWETAQPIARAHRLRPRAERGLLEIDIGEYVGLTLDRARKLPAWRLVQRQPSAFRFPGGESFVEMQARVLDTIARIVARHPDETIVVVSHGDPIRVAVAHALGIHLDLFQRIQIAPASISAVAYRAASVSVLTVNSLGDDLARIGLA